VTAAEQIEGGTSGGPIINAAGELVGIVSVFSYDENATKVQGQGCTGSASCPHLALPVWVMRLISSQEDQ
jgi:hypothetical protein